MKKPRTKNKVNLQRLEVDMIDTISGLFSGQNRFNPSKFAITVTNGGKVRGPEPFEKSALLQGAVYFSQRNIMFSIPLIRSK